MTTQKWHFFKKLDFIKFKEKHVWLEILKIE